MQIFVFNCFFPFTRAHITKHSYDTLLILLNDLSIWQQRNTSSSLTPTESTFASFETNIPQNVGFEDISLNEDTLEQRQRAGGEFIGIASDVKPSLASLVVSTANGTNSDNTLLMESGHWLTRSWLYISRNYIIMWRNQRHSNDI